MDPTRKRSVVSKYTSNYQYVNCYSIFTFTLPIMVMTCTCILSIVNKTTAIHVSRQVYLFIVVACQVQRVQGERWTNVKGLSSQYLSVFSSSDPSVSMPLTQANYYSSHIYRLCQSINSYDWTSFNSSFDSRVQLSIIPSKITIIVIDIVVVCHSNITGWSSKFAVAEATFKHTNSNIIYSLTGNSHGKDIFIHDYQNVNFLITVRTE